MNAKYTEEILREAVENSTSYRGVVRFLGLRQAGGTQSHLKRRIEEFNIDTSHFAGQGWNRGKVSSARRSAESILILRSEGGREKVRLVRRAMLEMGVVHECVKCGIGPEWNGEKLTLEVDHINGEWLDDRLENLRFLCPNCHSQEPTSRSWKNKDR